MDYRLLFYFVSIFFFLLLFTIIIYYKKKIAYLTRCNKSLLKANKNYLDMLGFVSHELKGIMGSVIMCVYSVRDGFLGMMNFHQRKALDAAVRNLERLEDTVKNYLDLSRIEKGELKARKRKINIKDITMQAKDTFSKQISEKEMVFKDNVPKDLNIFADKDQLKTVYDNLLSNAIKYGKKGGRIILNFEKLEEFLQFSVYNDGEVISQAKRDNLFKKFYRLSTEEYKKISGTGLGLFITKKIVENHGGRIWVEPKEKGNEFIFKIKKGGE